MRGGTAGRAALLIGFLAFALSAPAQAGTVEFDGVVTFRAAPGESNNLQITEAAGGVFTIVDSVPLTTESCFQADVFTAVCSIEFGISVAAEMGDLDDTAVIVVDFAPRVDGGEGADTITVSADLFADASMDGGPGDDEISTRATFSEIYGRGGNDLIDARNGLVTEAFGGWGDDRLLGGIDEDFFVSNRGHDTLIGGAGRDVLHGDGGHDVVRGGRGHDVLSGSQGDDVIIGGAGSDFARGGRGNDTFLMRDGYLDRIRGSYGFDRAAIDQYDRVRFVERLL